MSSKTPSQTNKANVIMKKEVFNQYAERIALMFGISKEELFSKTKQRHIADARHLLYYMCSTRPMELIYIQNFLGDEGYVTMHPPIIHGIKKVTQRLKDDRDYKAIVDKLKQSVTI